MADIQGAMNPATLYLILDCMTLVGAGLLLGMGVARRSATLKWWGGSYFVGSLGLGSIIVGYTAQARMPVTSGSAIVLCAYGMLWAGTRSLSQTKTSGLWIIPAGLIWLVIGQVPPLGDSESLRIVAYGPFAAGYMFLLAREFARVPGRPPGPLRYARLPSDRDSSTSLGHSTCFCDWGRAHIASGSTPRLWKVCFLSSAMLFWS